MASLLPPLTASEKTSMKGTIGPGRRPLAYLLYYIITVSPACAYIRYYGPPIGCSVVHRAAISLAAEGLCGVSEGSMSSFKSIT